MPAIKIEVPKKDNVHYGAACFHRSNRIAIATFESVIVLDPAKPAERVEFECPLVSELWVHSKLIVSPDDAWIAARAGQSHVAYWEVATKKGTAVSLVPEKTQADDTWRSGGVFFSPKGSLLSWRGESKDEVPEKTREMDVPAERRGVVRIDLRDKKVIPLNMGQSACTMTCVIDPTGTWLATGGLGHRDNATKKEMWTGELRVYHLPTGKLAFREQLEGLPLGWLAFTPSGKRIVSAAGDGVVRWWDVQEK